MASSRAKPPSPDSPIAQGAPRTLSATIRSMQLGLHFITAVLIVVACLRALADGSPAAPVLLGALVFSGWYVGGVVLAGRVDDRPVAAWWLAGLALIWVGTVAASAEFIWLAFPLWLLAGYILRWRWAVICSVAVFLVVAVAPPLHFGTTSYANVIGPLLGGTFALFIARGYVELVNDLQERQRLVASLVHAQTEMAALQEELAKTQRLSGAKAERTRISRDIHDTVAQGLSSISLLTTAALERGELAAMPRTLEQIDALARDNLVDVRRIVAALAPAALDEGALSGALRRMLERLTEETGLATEFRVDENLPALPTTVEVALLRTAQSALANVRQHAEATRVVVNLADAGDSVRLDIVDDGAGFDTSAWHTRSRGSGAATTGGYGLHSMRARLHELGGGLDVESAPSEGTALSAHVPLAAKPLEDPQP
ncbi:MULTISPECIES: sensor histidine kinase [unclassified Leucobacter]|uniref:sensor histidine kinase n=1 Tax=unclassified Leucobacter TaxID=2621730 RepID=UPI00165D61A2|nr:MULTISPECIES: sensor histidine kinase [unclassified Leucobacter]MBC9927810.1 sensor histidine kinase [Leucobacter sp. cx-169]